MYSPREEERACALGKEGHLKGEGGEAREAELAESSGRKSRGERPRLKRGFDLLLCAKGAKERKGGQAPPS